MNPTGWVACLGVLWAMWLTGNKNRLGFVVGALAEFLWIIYAWQIQAFELGIMSIVFVGVYIRNFILWKPTTLTESSPLHGTHKEMSREAAM